MFTITPEKEAEAARNQRWSAWIALIGKGNADALGALYDESSPVIFGLVLQILADRKLAEETLLDIYNHIRENARKFQSGEQTVLDWLIALARNFAVERLRESNLASSLKTIQDDPFRDKRHVANLILDRLPEEQRYILEMTYLGGLTISEVTDLLGVSREYVAKQIVSGTKTLKTFSRNMFYPAKRPCTNFVTKPRKSVRFSVQ